jgi:hypothetical protein
MTLRPSLPSMPSKERYHRPRTFYPGTAFLPGTSTEETGKESVDEPECLSLHGYILPQAGKPEMQTQPNS